MFMDPIKASEALLACDIRLNKVIKECKFLRLHSFFLRLSPNIFRLLKNLPALNRSLIKLVYLRVLRIGESVSQTVEARIS